MEGVIAIAMSLAIPIVVIIFHSWVDVNKKNREKEIRQLIIEHNVDMEQAKLLIEEPVKKGSKYKYLRGGLLLLGLGLGALVDYLLGLDFQGLYPYIILAVGMGIGMLASFFIEMKLPEEKELPEE